MFRIMILFLVVIHSSFGQELKEVSISQSVNDSAFVNLKDYSKDFVYDMKYATEDNFLKAKVYDCAECLLRLKTVKALVAANKDFIKKGYKITKVYSALKYEKYKKPISWLICCITCFLFKSR